VTDRVPEAVNGVLGGLAQVCLELGEGLFNRVEVGAVGRQNEQRRTRRFDRLACIGRLWLDRLSIMMMSPGVSSGTSNWRTSATKAARLIGPSSTISAIMPVRRSPDEGGDLPVSMRHAGAQALATSATAVATRHVGGRPGFVDEHQPRRIEVERAIEPFLPAHQDTGAVLLSGVRRPFCA
jgi:hypothetical protein